MATVDHHADSTTAGAGTKSERGIDKTNRRSSTAPREAAQGELPPIWRCHSCVLPILGVHTVLRDRVFLKISVWGGVDSSVVVTGRRRPSCAA
jgi:hypothetical protein